MWLVVSFVAATVVAPQKSGTKTRRGRLYILVSYHPLLSCSCSAPC